MGFPVSDQITDNHGISILYFESGVMVSGIGIPDPIICRHTFPKIDTPFHSFRTVISSPQLLAGVLSIRLNC